MHIPHGTSDQVVDWRYWSEKRTLSAAQAAQLMTGLSPDLTSSERAELNIKPLLAYATKIFKFAQSKGIRELPMFKWLQWGNVSKIKIHPMFALKAIEKEMESSNKGGKF
jgi:hypothetical protein